MAYFKIQSTIMPPKISLGSRSERHQQRRAASAQCSWISLPMISSVNNRIQDSLPRIMSSLNLQQMKNRKSEGCKKYKQSLNPHCNFRSSLFSKSSLMAGVCDDTQFNYFFSGLSSVGFKTTCFYKKHPMVISETPVKSQIIEAFIF